MKRKAAASKTRKQRVSTADMASMEAKIVADIKGGDLSYRQIGEKYGVSLPTVNNKARKYGLSRGRRKGAKLTVPGPRNRMAKRRGRKPKAVVSTTGVRRGRPPKSASVGAGFSAAFRQLVLQHYPNITLAKFDSLMRQVEGSIR